MTFCSELGKGSSKSNFFALSGAKRDFNIDFKILRNKKNKTLNDVKFVFVGFPSFRNGDVSTKTINNNNINKLIYLQYVFICLLFYFCRSIAT